MSVCSNCQWDNAFCQKCGQRLENPALVAKHDAFAPDHSHFERGRVVNGDGHHHVKEEETFEQFRRGDLLKKHVESGFPIKDMEAESKRRSALEIALETSLKEDGELRRKLDAFQGFWERAAAAVGLQHPPRRVDPHPIPPERAYMRSYTAGFDDGWREFTEEDVLNYLRSIRRR